MTKLLFFIKTFRLLRNHQPGKLVLIFGLTMVLGITSGFSIVILIPLLHLLNIGNGGDPEGFALFVQKMADRAGIDLNIGSILLIYALLLTISALVQFWKSIVDARYQQTFIYSLRRRLFRKIIMSDWAMLNSRSRTNHLQVLTREVPNLAYYYSYYLKLLTTLIMAGAFIAYAVIVSPEFTLITAATGLAVFIIFRKFLWRAYFLGQGYVSSYNRLLKYIDDFWQTVKIAKVHSSEDFYYNRFDEASSSLLDMEYRMHRNWSYPQLIQRISGLIVLVTIVWFGYRSGSLPISSLAVLILLFSRIFPQMVAINTDLNIIVTNVASVKLVMQLDEELPDPSLVVTGSATPVVLREKIILENLSFSYPGSEKLFTNLNAVIRANSITGIIGPSGRGKTTLVDIISGLQKPESGRVLIDGRNLDDYLLSGWRASLGYLPQDTFFIDGTLRENLVWDSDQGISDEQILNTLSLVNAIHLVSRFRKGLDAFVVNYHTSFSGGECQRLALARVLLRNPSVLLLDEATSSLDAENETIIMEALAKLKERITIVFVTHRISVAGWFDDTISI